MPSVRRFFRPSAKRRLIVAFASVTALAAAFVSVEPPASSACPISMPLPLRVRFERSDLVAVARVGDSVAGQKRGVGTLTSTELHLTSLLKGEVKEKVVKFQHLVWALPVGELAATDFQKDEVLLVFLRRPVKGEGEVSAGSYVSVEGERGMQKLPKDDLKVYVRRIEELAAIMRGEKPDEAALTEWLVRCAEEPATRWEGAFELAANVSQPPDPPDEESEADEEAEPDEEAEEVEAGADDGGEQETGQDRDNSSGQPAAGAPASDAGASGAVESNDQQVVIDVPANSPAAPPVDFAALLTPAQKERLTTTLLNAEELKWGDQLLLSLVGGWKDERVVPFALKHLARTADQPPYHAEDMVRIVAHTLGDQTLIKLAANYCKTAAYNDFYTDNVPDAAVAAASAYEGEPEDTPEERAQRKKEWEEMKAAAVEARFQRSGKLRHFLALADQPQKP
jgi:hypothetical protein